MRQFYILLITDVKIKVFNITINSTYTSFHKVLLTLQLVHTNATHFLCRRKTDADPQLPSESQFAIVIKHKCPGLESNTLQN